MTPQGSDDGPGTAVVLDFLPNGRPGDDRPQYQKNPVAYALGEEEFRLYEFELEEDERLVIGDRLPVEGDERVASRREVAHDDLPGGAQSELEYAVTEIVEEDERRFVDFYNDAQAITTRLHALNLLPGIGKKLRNNVLDERKRKPFESFEELEDRVSGLHNAREVLVERVMEELTEEELKYRIFARRPGDER
jgi:putative nucleotide binding protein